MDLIVKVYTKNEPVFDYRGDYKLIKLDKYYWTFYSYNDDPHNIINLSLYIDREIDNVFLETPLIRDDSWNFLFEEGDLERIKCEYSS